MFEPQDSEYGHLRGLFPAVPSGRTIIRIAVDRISDSCGYGVPGYAYEGERTQLPDWAERKGAQGLADYQKEKNRTSIDDLPALHCVAQAEA